MLFESKSMAVLMMAYGGPNSPADVEPYLLDVRGGRPTAPELIAEIRARYVSIGGRSPLLEITLAQAHALEECLNRDAAGEESYRVYVGMRHWAPRIQDALGEIVRDGQTEVIGLCMAPHYSRLSVGAYFQKLEEAQAALGVRLNVTPIRSWHTHPLFLDALEAHVRAALSRFDPTPGETVKILFTAHSLPAAAVGDPYQAQLQETTARLVERLALPPDAWEFCFQSAGASGARWLSPAIEDVILRLCEAGQKNILVAPIGFVADHVEILYDLDIEARSLAAAHGARLERIESMNASPEFITALAAVVRSAGARAGTRG
jgi:ferrochelatase